MRAQAAAVLCLVLLLRLPFLNQAIQGDDFYYLKGAEHALIDPLHPTHARYVFEGQTVDMRGHPHPPLNAWYLALWLALFRSEAEPPLHAAYIPFSAIAALSALALARRFSTRPLPATALFMVTPAFVVNGSSLEADLPFVALWLLTIALFVYQRWWLSALAGVLAALAAYQAVVLAPVLAWWFIVQPKRRAPAWIAVLSAPATVIVWQLYERFTSGALPASVLAGYMSTYNLQAFTQKLKSAAALTGHTGWLVFPVLALLSFWRGPLWIRAGSAAVIVAAAMADPNPLFWSSCGIGALVLLTCLSQLRDFLCWWIAVFFAAALIIFFAGSARYLLPVVLPLAILVSNRLSPRILGAGIAAEALLSVSLAMVNYQHWDGYRQFAKMLEPEIRRHRTWTNAEWGLRHYVEAEGGRPVTNGRAFWPGDLIVSTAYAAAPPTGSVIAERDIASRIPLRIAGLNTDSGYSSVSFGLAPFGISRNPMDRVRALLVAEQKAELSALIVGTPQAAGQIVSGVYNNDRWTGDRAILVLKHPRGATRIEARIFIPAQSPARTVRLSVDGKLLAEHTYPAPGPYTISVPAPAPGAVPATVAIEVDRTFSVPPDQRKLGILLLSIGFR